MPLDQLRARTRFLAVRVIHFYRTLPRTEEARVIGRQLLRAATAVGANCRAACRPRSDADFIAKIGLVIEEADETAYWLELLVDAEVSTMAAVGELQGEVDQLIRIFVASRATARRNAGERRIRTAPRTTND